MFNFRVPVSLIVLAAVSHIFVGGCNFLGQAETSNTISKHIETKKDKRVFSVVSRPIDAAAAYGVMNTFMRQFSEETKPVRKAQLVNEMNKAINAMSFPVILSENPPDVTIGENLTVEFSGDAVQGAGELKAEVSFSESLLEAADLQSQNYVLRDALYRLNEALLMRPEVFSYPEEDDDGYYFKPSDAYVKLFTEILELVKQLNDDSDTSDSKEPVAKLTGPGVPSEPDAAPVDPSTQGT